MKIDATTICFAVKAVFWLFYGIHIIFQHHLLHIRHFKCIGCIRAPFSADKERIRQQRIFQKITFVYSSDKSLLTLLQWQRITIRAIHLNFDCYTFTIDFKANNIPLTNTKTCPQDKHSPFYVRYCFMHSFRSVMIMLV